MPRLDTYRIEAWRCPYCYDIVLSDFQKHYRHCQSAERRREKQAELARLADYAAERERLFFHAPRLYSTSPQDFVERINYAVFGLYGIHANLRILDIYYDDPDINVRQPGYARVTNRECAPVGHSTNWCRQDKDAEFYFAGYRAKMNYDQDVVRRYHDRQRITARFFWSSELLTQFHGLHFGDGSIGYNYGNLFLLDFPKWNQTPGFYAPQRYKF